MGPGRRTGAAAVREGRPRKPGRDEGFYLRAPTAVVNRFDATVDWFAQALKTLGDPDPEDARRVKACLILANRAPRPPHHHRIKTFGCWEVKQPFPGIHLWRDPHGRLYLADHTGTRRATTRPVASSHSNGHRPDLAIELYPSPDTVDVTDDFPSAG